MTIPSRLAVALLVLSGSLLARPAVAALPADLDAVPRDAAGFVHIRAVELWQNDLLADTRHFIAKAGPEAIKDFQKMFAPNPADIERVTIVFLGVETMSRPIPQVDPEAVSALAIVAAKNPIDRARLIKQMKLREKKYGNHLYQFSEDMWSGLAFLDDKTFVFGAEDSLVKFFDMSGKRQGPLDPALAEASKQHLAVFGWNPDSLVKHPMANALPPDLKPLLVAQCATVSFDFDSKLQLHTRFDFADGKQAEAGAKALRSLLDLARLGLGMGINQLDAELRKDADKVQLGDIGGRFGILLAAGFLRDLDEVVKKTPVEKKDAAVSYNLDYEKRLVLKNGGGAMLMVAATYLMAGRGFSSFGRFSSPEQEKQEEMRMKKLSAALEKYQKEKGHYPPAALLNSKGEPNLSWRVALLPYLGEEELFKQFKLDEPWDSLHNKRLIKKMPQVFRAVENFAYSDEIDLDGPQGKRGKRLKTTDLVFTGPNTAFEGKKGLKSADIDDKTILVLSADSDEVAVYWTKPADLKYEPGQPLPEVFGRFNNGPVYVILKNGTFKAIQPDQAGQLKDLIERKKK
ncbi:MAG: DUF1559 domain-containing protein [Gemmataceae bacterium]